MIDEYDCPTLFSIEEYRQKLSDHGFEVLSCDNITKEWSKFVWNRCNTFISNKDAYIASPGSSEECYANNLRTYITACKLWHIDDPTPFPNVPVGPENNNKPPSFNGVIIFGKKKDK